LFEFGTSSRRPTSPFKFFEGWLSDPTYLQLVKNLWVLQPAHSQSPAAIDILEKLKGLKVATKKWAKTKQQKHEQTLKDIELKLLELHDGIGRGFLS